MHEVWFNYDEILLYVTTSQSWGEGKVDTRTDGERYRNTYLIEHTVRPLGIYITNSIGLVFSWIIIQSGFLWGN